jgi:hypothetical protein
VRRAAKVDRNQAEIVNFVIQCGATVQHLHGVGKGCPDLLVGYRGVNLLWEIKDGLAPLSKQRLTPDERDWHADWRGQVTVVSSIDQALVILQEVPMK